MHTYTNGDDVTYREGRNWRSIAITVGCVLWIIAGLATIALSGYRFWDTYTQRQDSYAFINEHKALDQKQRRITDAQNRGISFELARWKKINDYREKLYFAK